MGDDRPQLSDYRPSARSMWLLALVAFFVTRISILPLVLDFRADELLYQQWATLIGGGSFPVGYERYQYPPGAGLIFTGIDVAPGDFHRVFTLSVIAADVLIFALLLLRVKVKNDSWRGPWVWIVGGLLAGALMYERFDLFPTLIAVAALLFLSRPFLSGLFAGIGGIVKVWPIITLFALRRQDLVAGIAGALVGGAGVLMLAFLVAPHPLAFLTGQSERGLQIESTLAIPILVAAQLGLISAPSVDRYGSTELDAPFAGIVAWIGILFAVALVGSLLIQRLRGRLENIPGADVAFAVLLLFVASNRVLSPEYFVWIAGAASVVLLDRRSRMVIPVVLAFVSMLPITQYLGPFYWALQAQTVEAVSLQVVRGLLVLASALIAWWVVVSGRAYQGVVGNTH